MAYVAKDDIIIQVDVEKDFGFDSILSLANYIYKIFGLKAYNDLKNDKQRVVEAKNYKKIAISLVSKHKYHIK